MSLSIENYKQLPRPNQKLYDLVKEKANGNVNLFAKLIGIKQQNVDRVFKKDGRNDKFPSISGKIKDAVKQAFNIDYIYFLKEPNEDNAPTKNNFSTSTNAQTSSVSSLPTRPRVPYTVAAGKLTEALEGLTIEQCEKVPIINALPEYDFTIIVKGDSMEPKYEGGDEIACKRIDDTSFIQWGKVHVLDTAQGLILKRIYEDGDKIKCVSYNKDYPDFSIDKKEIYSMNLVVGLIRI